MTLVLGDQSSTKNVILSSTGHHHNSNGQVNVLYYHNDSPLSCAVDNGDDDDTDMHEFKVRHKHSGKIYTFKRSKGGFGKSCMVHDATSGHYASFDTSKTSSVTCGSSDDNFEVVGIEHKQGGYSCTSLTEEEEDDDVEDNQYD